MKKDNVRIKTNISLADKINAIEGIVSSYFTSGEYTPYYAGMAEVVAIATFFIEGLEFEKDESIYNSVISDKKLMELVSMFYNTRLNTGEVMVFVREQVKDKVDFVKQQVIHNHNDMNKIIDSCNVIIDSLSNFSKLDLSQINKEDMEVGFKVMKQLADKNFTTDDLSKAIKDAVAFDMDKATAEIIDAKNAEIRELKKYKTLWESRNVVSSDKVVTMPKNV